MVMDMELTFGLGNGTNFSHKSNFTNSNIILILPCKVHFAKPKNRKAVQNRNGGLLFFYAKVMGYKGLLAQR